MFSWLLFALSISAVLSDKEFLKFDYCTIKCGEYKHSACSCSRVPPREEIVDNPDLPTFRKMVLDSHNYWRNFIASGNETRPEEGACPAAANMMVMNYDLELEHIARCRALNSWRHNKEDKTGHDKCRRSMDDKYVGQNLFGSSVYRAERLAEIGKDGHWYTEVTLIDKETVGKYTSGKGIGHFTQVVWATANRMGCVRVHSSENVPSWQNSIICNYGSTVGAAGNVINKPLYEPGEPCSKCPSGHSCNTGPYTNLCGVLEPIPKDGVSTTGKGRGWWVKGDAKFCLIVVLFFSVFVQ